MVRNPPLNRPNHLLRYRNCPHTRAQEPKDQLLRLEVFDIDRLRPGKLLSGQVTQVVNGRQLMGRQLIKLSEACKDGMNGNNERAEQQVLLGDNDWGAPGGPGKGLGIVHMTLQYWPFERLTKYDVENAMQVSRARGGCGSPQQVGNKARRNEGMRIVGHRSTVCKPGCVGRRMSIARANGRWATAPKHPRLAPADARRRAHLYFVSPVLKAR